MNSEEIPAFLILKKKRLKDNNILYYSDKLIYVDLEKDDLTTIKEKTQEIERLSKNIFQIEALPFLEKVLYKIESENLLQLFREKEITEIDKKLQRKEGYYFVTFYAKENNYMYDFVVSKKDFEKIEQTEDIIEVVKNSNMKEFLCYSIEDETEEIEEKEEEIDITKKSIKEIYNNVTASIVGQNEAIKKILGAIYTNQILLQKEEDKEKIRLQKKVVLVTGPTGTGKTEIIKQIAKEFGINIVIEDATRFTKEGYVGASIQDIFKHLMDNADGDIELAENSILVIDEIDKLANKGIKNDVGSDSVQNALLKLMEGNEFPLESKGYEMFGDTFDSSYLTIIMLGAFTDIQKNKANFKNTNNIGFNSQITQNTETEEELTTEDFVNYGMVPEFMGRISNIVSLNKLNKEDLSSILINSKISPLNLKKNFLELMGIKINYNNNFINQVVDQAIKRETGARGLKTEINNIFDNYDFELLQGDIEELDLISEKPYIKCKKKKNN